MKPYKCVQIICIKWKFFNIKSSGVQKLNITKNLNINVPWMQSPNL